MRSVQLGRWVLGASCVVWLAACDQRERARQAEAARIAAVNATAARADPELQDAVGRAVAGAAQPTIMAGFEKAGPLWRGELGPRERRSFLVVLPYGHCYRFVAAAGSGVEDLDLALIDPNGVEAQRDITQEPFAVLGGDASICPVEAGAYKIEARMHAGAGPFAIALYRDLQ